MIRTFIAFFAAIGALSVAFAAGPSASLSWVLATTDVNGTTLPAGSIVSTHLVWRRHGQTTVTGTVDVAAPAITTVVAGLDCSQFDFSAQTVLVGATSDETVPPVVYDTGVVCKPNPPGALAAH